MDAKKSSQANLERKRPLFLAIGAIIALSFSLVAFEWRTFYSIEEIETQEPIYHGDPDDPLPPVTTIDEPKKPKPPKPPTAPPDPFKTDPQTEPADPSPEPEPEPVTYDPAPWAPVPIPEPDPEPEPKDPFDYVTEKARYNCLDKAIAEVEMLKEISKRIRYPWLAREEGIQGTVVVRFVVDKKGNVSDVEVLEGRSVGYGCDEEAIRVVKSMGQWCPAFHEGRIVASYYTLPIRFVLR